MKLMSTAALALAALVLFAACSDTQEQVDSSASPTAPATPTASPAGSGQPTVSPATSDQPTLSPTPVFPAQTAIEGGLAPGGCNKSEGTYVDPDGRFALCFEEGMEVSTTPAGSGALAVLVRHPVSDSSRVTVNVGWEEEPAYTPCSQTIDVVKNQHFERISVSGVTVEACVQEIYDITRPDTYLRTKVDFAIPVKDGAPILVEATFAGNSTTRDGFPASVIASRVVGSIKVY